MPKSNLYVSVVGKSGAGKSAVTSAIKRLLASHDFEVTTIWGPDGPINEIVADDRLKTLAKKTAIVLSELQVGRAHADDSCYEATVVYTAGIGYEAIVRVNGIPLRANFGDFTHSREKALALASRIAADLGIDMQDKTPRDYQVTQPRDYVP